jgi:hypothetical protein
VVGLGEGVGVGSTVVAGDGSTEGELDGSTDGDGSPEPDGDGSPEPVGEGVTVGRGVGVAFGVAAGARQTIRGGRDAGPEGLTVGAVVASVGDAAGRGLPDAAGPVPALPGLATSRSTAGSTPGVGNIFAASARIPGTSGIWIDPRGSGRDVGWTSG